MKKTLLFVGLAIVGLSANAQTPQIGEKTDCELPRAISSDRVADTLDQYLARATGATLYSSVDGGYISGTAYFDPGTGPIAVNEAVGSHFDAAGNVDVTEVLVWFGAAVVEGTADNVTAAIYSVNSDSSANTLLGSATITTSDLNPSTSFSLSSFMFSTPAATGNASFLAAIEFAGTTDTLGIVTSDPGAGDGAGEQRFRGKTTAALGGTWGSPEAVWGPLDADIFIFPVVDVAAGVDAIQNGLTLSAAYPNPANDITTIPFELNESSNVTIRVYNLQGQEIHSESTTRGAGEHLVDVDLNGVTNGSYYYTISTDKGAKLTAKFVVAK